MPKEHDQNGLNNPESQKPEEILIDCINKLSKTRKKILKTNRVFMANLPEPFLAKLPEAFNDPKVNALGIAIDCLVAFGKKAGYIDKNVDSRDYY